MERRDIRAQVMRPTHHQLLRPLGQLKAEDLDPAYRQSHGPLVDCGVVDLPPAGRAPFDRGAALVDATRHRARHLHDRALLVVQGPHL